MIYLFLIVMAVMICIAGCFPKIDHDEKEYQKIAITLPKRNQEY